MAIGTRIRTVAVLALLVGALTAHAQPQTTVGITGRLEAVVLPGSELAAKPDPDRKAAVVVRVAAVYPHGSDFRYDLEYFALTPGTHDLRQYLVRKDGTPVGELPPLQVKVTETLPPGQIKPNALEIAPGPRVGGYKWLVAGAIALWSIGLIALVASFFLPRRKKAAADADTPVSLADKLRPLVEGAVAGKLSQAELAGLERGLLAYWRKRLKLEDADPGEAAEKLRSHPEAGPLLAKLEAWLHRPGEREPVDVPALLAPYRDLPPEAIDLAGGAP
jgi:hypothetical protein